MKKTLIAHSPDADDVFMYYAIKFGWIDMEGVKFENIAEDIQTLNEKALGGVYEIVAISFALYPHIREDYALLRTAVSFGDGYGPKIIRKKDVKLKRNFKVA
ncbi:MAG: MqnA/MqnD/SBP family protein, partial [Sulfurimonas sp.]|nr:MqnA/MqnD/SBP family protein [Sulfurimonas sp.]